MPQLNESEILAVWEALPSDTSENGWRHIDLFRTETCRIKAAKHAPRGDEAIFVGFVHTNVLPSSSFTQSSGFRIERVDLVTAGVGCQWLAIVRQPNGSLEMFAKVVSDISNLLEKAVATTEQAIYNQILGRVRGWQEFMRRSVDGLTDEEELGLVGELTLLHALISEEVAIHAAITSWRGPHDGLHDFLLGQGAIEVKSTLAQVGIPIKVGSLEQLDVDLASPLYLCVNRFVLHSDGIQLPVLVDSIRTLASIDAEAARLLELALYKVGYQDSHCDRYLRKFSCVETMLYEVDDKFPRIVRHMLSPAVTSARYDLELSGFDAKNYSAQEVIVALGVK